MIIKEIKSFYLINKIKEHNDIKNNLINLINKIPINKIDVKTENISHTDWNLPNDCNREYVDFFRKIIKPYIEKISLFLNTKDYRVHNFWFQKYKNQDFHNWHIHPDCNFSNVYYLNLPEKNMRTKIFNIVDKSFSYLDVTEGDLITFPSFLHHKSEANKNNQDKIIIAFNTSFDNINSEEIEKYEKTKS
jgi:hypothetical protein